jgi:hypothetical protein
MISWTGGKALAEIGRSYNVSHSSDFEVLMTDNSIRLWRRITRQPDQVGSDLAKNSVPAIGVS